MKVDDFDILAAREALRGRSFEVPADVVELVEGRVTKGARRGGLRRSLSAEELHELDEVWRIAITGFLMPVAERYIPRSDAREARARAFDLSVRMRGMVQELDRLLDTETKLASDRCVSIAALRDVARACDASALDLARWVDRHSLLTSETSGANRQLLNRRALELIVVLMATSVDHLFGRPVRRKRLPALKRATAISVAIEGVRTATGDVLSAGTLLDAFTKERSIQLVGGYAVRLFYKKPHVVVTRS